MSKHYNHLSAEKRAVVQIEIQDGKGMRSIAKRLGRSPSALSREVARQRVAAYSATEAGKAYRTRRLRSVRYRRLSPDVLSGLIAWRTGLPAPFVQPHPGSPPFPLRVDSYRRISASLLGAAHASVHVAPA